MNKKSSFLQKYRDEIIRNCPKFRKTVAKSFAADSHPLTTPELGKENYV